MAFRAIPVGRTEGDGMENVDAKTSVVEGKDGIFQDTFKSAKNQESSSLITLKTPAMPARKISGPLVNPRAKEPKFVPFEPYKAAVRPIIPKKKKYKLPSLKGKESRSRTTSYESNRADEFEEAVVDTPDPITDSKYLELEGEVRKLKLENEELETELKMQVQINGELRNLLVASVGEDIETRVSCLAVDKEHLAQKLINTAKNLSTHHEQIEWLASQCEVWRSKFLACSVMVEELAKWKASLSHKISETEHVLKRLMDERKQVRKQILTTHSNLSYLRDNFDVVNKRVTLASSNIMDLSADSVTLSNGLVIRLMNKTADVSQAVHELPSLTDAEKAADFMLKHPHPLSLIEEPDAACSAVVGAAVAIQSQLYHQNNPPRISCCPQCTGPISLV